MTGPRRGASIGGWPVATIAFVVVAALVQFFPASATWLGFEREALARGELWRALSGHLVHGPPGLAFFDLAAFALFGTWVERTSRRLFVAVIVTSAIASASAIFFLTQFEHYVGSSALVSGLLVAAAVGALRGPGRASRLVGGLLLAFLAAKVVLDLLELWPAAFGGLPPGYESVGVAHVGGALGGIWAVFFGGRPPD